MPETKYLQIAAELEAELVDLPGGTRIQSEAELAERFGVGRAAIRAALQLLQRRSLIRRVKGAGSFVVRRIDYVIDSRRAPSWSRTVRDAGGTPESVTLSCSMAPVPADVAAHLGLKPGASCHRLTRRSLVDGLPAAWGIEWVPPVVAADLPELLRVHESLYEVLTAGGSREPHRAWVRAGADIVTAEVARHLDLDESTLGWYIESLTTDSHDDRPLCLSQRWIRADAIRVVFQNDAVH